MGECFLQRLMVFSLTTDLLYMVKIESIIVIKRKAWIFMSLIIEASLGTLKA